VTTTPDADQPYTDTVNYSSNPGDALASAKEAAAITHHQLTLNGTTINYTATAGHLTASNIATGTPEASFFYVAYTADNQPAATRPITFFYNGGPGSSTIWLHMGSFGPKRLVTGDPSSSPVTPFPLVDNQESLLDTTDIVFIDAIGTGYSEAIAPNTNQTFWGVDSDVGAFRDFVMRYIAVNQRQASPKFLFGESYGTTRTGVLSNALESAGVQLNGIVVQSCILNYNNSDLGEFIPTFGAIGSYYKLTNPLPTDLPTYLTQLRSFAANTYDPVANQIIASGTTPTDFSPYSSLIAQLTAYTGAGASYWMQTGLLPDPDAYRNDLIPNTLIGRYDARVSAPNNSALAADGDPSDTVISAPFASAIATYLPSVLGYTSSATYTTVNDGNNFTWDFSHDGQQYPDVIPDIAAALTLNPKMKILSLNGYYDLATPFYGTEEDLARLGSTPKLQLNHYYGGHMIYLDDTARPLEKADVVAFIRSASGG
jgi:carboxypeptidase C (cathepsin A)